MAESATDKTPERLSAWLARMGPGDLPILSETNRQIAAAARKEGSTATELANIVLRDPAMTSQVLRIANTVFYNPSCQRINTISRAVIVLGFNAIFSICVSRTLVETATDRSTAGNPMLGTIARSLHAAVQARALAEAVGEKEPEDLFIAALLYRLGDIALWAYAPGDARRIEDLVAVRGLSPEEAQRDILGFTTAELTLAMSREWNLSPALERALMPEHREHPQSRLIAMADRACATIAAAERSSFAQVAEDVAARLGKPRREARDFLYGNLKKAGELVSSYGLNAALLEQPALDATLAAVNTLSRAPDGEDRHVLRLQILGEIAAMLAERAGMGLLLEMVVEGIYRGIDMDRTALLLLSPDRKVLGVKLALGGDPGGLSTRLRLPLQETPWLRRLLASGQAAWFDPTEQRFAPDASFRAAVGNGSFFIMPVGTPERAIGLLFADRHTSGHPLTEGDFAAFRLFGQQACLGLTYLEHQPPRRT